MHLLAQMHCPHPHTIHIFPRSKWHMLQAIRGVFTNESNRKLLSLTSSDALRRRGSGPAYAWQPSCVQSAADDVVTYARQVTDLAATDQYYRVLLQVVTDTGDVAGTFDLVGQTYTCNLTQCGIRLLGGLSLNRQADAALLRTGLQNRGIRLAGYLFSTLADQLIDRRH